MNDTEIAAVIAGMAFVLGLVARELIGDMPILFGKEDEENVKSFRRHKGTPPEVPRQKCKVELSKNLSGQLSHFAKQGVKVRLK